MIPDSASAILSTRYNFQKIYMEGTTVINVTSSGAVAQVYTLATHSLGYIPTVRVFYIPVSGELWPLGPNQYDNTDGGSGTKLEFYGSPILTTTALKVKMVNSSGSDTNITFYYRIYLDE